MADKYDVLRTHQTNGANYDLGTDDVIAKFKDWDERFGIDVSNVSHDAVTVQFRELPSDVSALAQEIYEFCPDTVDQHFGCFAEVIEAADESEMELPDEVRELAAGVDFDDEDYGMELLRRSLQKNRSVHLWWD